jgi:hypothetical protein
VVASTEDADTSPADRFFKRRLQGNPMAAEVTHHAVITHEHGDYKRGDMETDPKKIEALLRDHPTKVARITAP